jgi:PAS domain S-box-containing protein
MSDELPGDAGLSEAEMRKNQAALAESNRHYEQLLAASPYVIYSAEAKPDYATLYVSPNVYEHTGYRADEFLRRGFWVDKIHPADREKVLEGLDRLLEFGSNSHQYRFMHADGSYRWMRGKQRVVRDETGAPATIAGQWTDLSDAMESVDELDRFFSVTTSAAKPPATMMANITRNRLMTQAMPMPRAAHWTHQSPGDVVQLMTNSRTRIIGPTNRNFNARSVLIIVSPT